MSKRKRSDTKDDLLKKVSALYKKCGNKMLGQDFLATSDKSMDEILLIAETALYLQHLEANNQSCKVFEGSLATSIFRDQSTRTRFAYASAAALLGLCPFELDERKSQVAHGETVRETATMISFLTECVGIRDDLFVEEGHRYMSEFAAALQQSYNEKVLNIRPIVINLQSDRDHPTQAIADIMHLRHLFGDWESIKGKTIAVTWAYSPSYGKPLSVPQGCVSLFTRLGAHVRLAYPENYDLLPDIIEQSKKFASECGGSLTIGSSMQDAVKGADVVYAKSWGAMALMKERTKAFREGTANTGTCPAGITCTKKKLIITTDVLKKLEQESIASSGKLKDSWTLTAQLMSTTNNAHVMHCLPADITGVSCTHGEVDSDVFDKHRVEMYLEAKNKPHAIAAMMLAGRVKDYPSKLGSGKRVQ